MHYRSIKKFLFSSSPCMGSIGRRGRNRTKRLRDSHRGHKGQKEVTKVLKEFLWALSPVRCFHRRRRLGKRLELGDRSVRRIFIFLCDLFSDLCDLCVTLSTRAGSSFSILFPSPLPRRSSSSSNGLETPPPGHKKIHPFPRNEPFAQDRSQSQFRRRRGGPARIGYDSRPQHPPSSRRV